MLQVPWTENPYQTVASLVNASWYVFVGNVRAEWTVAVGTIPVTLYNVTAITILKLHALTSFIPGQGGYVQVGEVGGTAANSTMSLQGYPTLSVGEEYVFFTSPSGGASPNAPFQTEINLSVIGTLVEMTQGGPQGLFNISGGKVYSMDQTYPQTDSWIPTKVSGVPLSQFIAEIQEVVTSAAAPSP